MMNDSIDLNDESDEQIHDPDELHALKQSGQPKPPGVKWSAWEDPLKLSYRHKALINRAALGVPRAVIAVELGITVQHVGKLLRGPTVAKAIEERMENDFRILAEQRLQELLPLALNRLQFIMANDAAKESSQVEAAKFVVDRLVPKPKQTIEHTGNLAMDVFHQIKLLQRERAMHPEFQEPKPRSPVDDFLKRHMPEGFVVGRKDKSEPAD